MFDREIVWFFGAQEHNGSFFWAKAPLENAVWMHSAEVGEGDRQTKIRIPQPSPHVTQERERRNYVYSIIT